MKFIRAVLAAAVLMSGPSTAQTLDPEDPFRVLQAKFITVTSHLGDGRIENRPGVRLVVQSQWAHSEADRTAFIELVIADPGKFTRDSAIVKAMANAEMMLLVVDFYKGAQTDVVQEIQYFKDTRRRGWERLVAGERTP
uniref:Uncharacterized protein n=1 Tax=Bosea sp. NBC_00436 TaxID=2969620 RepID=A0A9E8A0U2_9HYPH